MGTVLVISEFGKALLFIAGAAIFVLGGLLTNKLIAPNRPNPEKDSTYECGEDPVGNARIQLNLRFYVVALIFLIFDVEIIFFFPWSTVFASEEIIQVAPQWGWFALVEVLIFAGILLLGLAYVWVKGDLDWIRPEPEPEQVKTAIPESAYTQFNIEQNRKPEKVKG